MTRNPQLPVRPNAPSLVAISCRDPALREALFEIIGQLSDVEIVAPGDANVALVAVGHGGTLGLADGLGQDIPVVAVLERDDQAADALRAGARGVVRRAQLGAGVAAALTAVRMGLVVVDAALAGAVTGTGAPTTALPRVTERTAGSDSKVRIGSLTGREKQVAQLLTLGLSNKLIADRLGISDHTAKFHVNGVMGKLGVTTRTEAVVEAVRRGLVQL
jgi:DNA-binding NarL/FixJ family response regulator